LQQKKYFGEKATLAVSELVPLFITQLPSNLLFDSVNAVFRKGNDHWARQLFLRRLSDQLENDARVWQLIREVATQEPDLFVRAEGLRLLANGQRDDPTTWQLVRMAATQDPHDHVREIALRLLASGRKDDPTTWQLIREAATNDSRVRVRGESLVLLAQGQQDNPATWELICEAATQDRQEYVRSRACGLLLEKLNCTELQRKLMSVLFGGYEFRHDPKSPIASARVAYAAQRLNLDVDEVRRQCEALAAQLPIALTVEWHRPS
jgi:hypothetical protein